MDNFLNNSSIVTISNGIIDDISHSSDNTFLTVTYTDTANNTNNNTQSKNSTDSPDFGTHRQNYERTIILITGSTTVILNGSCQPISIKDLSVGMSVNAYISPSMTRSIPPQSNAFVIQQLCCMNTQTESPVTIGRIIETDTENRTFTTVQQQNPASAIRFNVPAETPIFDRNGNPTDFSKLIPGVLVWVKYADFMTASLPPQTTALEIRIR